MRRFAFVALLAACGSDGGGPISIDDLDEAVRDRFCNMYVDCGLIDDHATCRQIYGELVADADLIAAVKAGKVIYHEDKAGECLAGLAGSCERDSFFDNNAPAACDETFEGTVNAGGQCAMDEECISQVCDIPGCSEACCYGTCVGSVPQPRPRVGSACMFDGPECVDSFCDSATSVCTAYRKLGETCSGSSQCGEGACQNQICTKLPGPGEACMVNTLGGSCGHLGYTCSQTSMTCVAYGLTGDPCTTARDCSPLYQCNPSSTCELRPTLGDTCGASTTTSDCIDDSYCEPTTMRCTAPKADGAMCMSGDECIGDCDSGTNTCMTAPLCF